VLLHSADLSATARPRQGVTDLERGPHPDFGLPVAPLYPGTEDVLHPTEGGTEVFATRRARPAQQSQAERGNGVPDHTASRATDCRAWQRG
jgi:hypothetical protein